MFLTSRTGLLVLFEGALAGVVFGALGFSRESTRFWDEEFVLIANAFLVLSNSVYLLAAGIVSGDTIKINLYNLLYHGCAAGIYISTTIAYFRLHVDKDQHLQVASNALGMFAAVLHIIHMIFALKGQH
ncbi:uncharacterized protein LOC135399035 [Ornithodoros turicata]